MVEGINPDDNPIIQQLREAAARSAPELTPEAHQRLRAKVLGIQSVDLEGYNGTDSPSTFVERFEAGQDPSLVVDLDNYGTWDVNSF